MTAQALLPVGRENPLQLDRWGVPGLKLLGTGQRVAQELLIAREHRGDVGGADAALEAVHQRVIGRQPERRRHRVGGLAHQRDDLDEIRRHRRKIRVAARLPPDLLACGVGAGLRLDQVVRDRGRADMGVAHQAEVSGIPFVGSGLSGPDFSLGKVVGDLRRGQQAVRQTREHRELVAPGGASTRRHHGGGVPPQDGGCLADGGDAGKSGG